MKRKVYIFYHEGNVYGNPQVYEVLNLLNDLGYVQTLISFESTHKYPIPDFIESLVIPRWWFFIFKISSKIIGSYTLTSFILHRLFYRNQIPDIILGVDEFGAICMSLDKFRHSVSVYFNFEIIFGVENRKEFLVLTKAFSKLSACKIVSPDYFRHNMLIKEYTSLRKNSYETIPISYSDYFIPKCSNTSKKITILFSGSIAKWSGIYEFLDLAFKYRDLFDFVIHHRAGNSREKIKEVVGFYPEQIIFSEHEPLNAKDYLQYISSFDIGFVCYTPDFGKKYLGKNIQNVGFSSGKFCSFLQSGLIPFGKLDSVQAQVLKDYGIYFESLDELFKAMVESRDDLKFRSKQLFKEKISWNVHKEKFLTLIG